MYDVLRRLAAIGFVVLVLQLSFFGLLVVAQGVPDRPIVSNLVSAVEDGTYGPTGRPDLMGGRSASHSECVMVGTGLGRPDMGVFERAIRMPRISSCAGGAEDLHRLERGEPVEHVTEYFRYWGGYTVLTRPVLALWGLEGLRMVSGGLLALSGAAALVMVGRASSTTFVAGLALPLLLASNVMSTPSSSFGFALSYAAALLAVMLTAHGARYGIERAVMGAAVGAAIFNYTTQLTTPAIPWMMSATVAGAIVFSRTHELRQTMGVVGAVCVAWPIAFGITWASRWAVSALFIGWDDVAGGVRDKVDFRLGGASQSVRLSFGAATNANVRYWLDNVPTARAVLVTVVGSVAVSLIISYRRFGTQRLALFGMLCLPAVIAPLWYEVLRNHSQIHPSFVYANIPAALGIILAAALFAASRTDQSAAPKVPHTTPSRADPPERTLTCPDASSIDA